MKELRLVILFVSMFGFYACNGQESKFSIEKDRSIIILIPLSDSIFFSEQDTVGVVNWNQNNILSMLEKAVTEALPTKVLKVFSTMKVCYLQTYIDFDGKMLAGRFMLDSLSYSKIDENHFYHIYEEISDLKFLFSKDEIDQEFSKVDGTFDYTTNAWPLTGKKFSYNNDKLQ